jgi:hypothetical protein
MTNLEKIIRRKLVEDGADISAMKVSLEWRDVVRGYARVIISGLGVRSWLNGPYHERPWTETFMQRADGSVWMLINLCTIIIPSAH